MIFISFHHKSKDIVDEVVKRLQELNLELWYDENPARNRLSQKMQEEITHSSLIICFISKLYIKSKSCQLEFYCANNSGKKCVHIILQELELNAVNGIEMYLFGNSLRLDAFKYIKDSNIDEETIESIVKDLQSIIIADSDYIENMLGIRRDDNFIGRNDLFKQIDEKFKDNKTILLHGLPGVGKTSCAIEYIFSRKQSHGSIQQHFVFYADKIHKIRHSISKYCKQLDLCNDSCDVEVKISKFKEYLEQSDCILIFDNVENFEDVESLINNEALNKLTIMTSNKTPDRFNGEKIEVLPFNLIELKKYIKKKQPLISDEDSQNIINYLKIENNCFTYKAILIVGLLCNNEILTVNDLTLQNCNNSYFNIIVAEIEKENEDAVLMLKFLCLLDPDEIPKMILDKIPIENPLSEVLQILLNYNLCKIVNPNSTQFGIRIHRILQNDIKKYCFENENELNQITDVMADILNVMFPDDKTSIFKKLDEASSIYTHVIFLLENNQDNHNLVFSHLYFKASYYEFNVNHDYKKSLEYSKKDEKIKKMHFDSDNEELSTTLSNIGLIYSSLKNTEEALRYYHECLDMDKRLFSGDNQGTAKSLNNIGLIYRETGNKQMALKYFEDSLKIRKRLYKGDHHYVATSLFHCGEIHKDLQNLDESFNYLKDSLLMRRRLFKNDENLDLAASLNSVGLLYKDLNKKREALKYLIESLEMRQRIYNGDTKSIAVSFWG
jgi:tetratricopeptide (TPR) repeat protein